MSNKLNLEIINDYLLINPQEHFGIYIITKSIILYGNNSDLKFENAVGIVIDKFDNKLKDFRNKNIDYRKILILDEYLQPRYNNILFKQFCVNIKNSTEIHFGDLIDIYEFVDKWKNNKEDLLLLFNYITLFNTEQFDIKKIAHGEETEIEKYRVEKLFYLINIDKNGNEKELTEDELECVEKHIQVLIKSCKNILNEISRREDKWDETNDCDDIEYFEDFEDFDIINKKEKKRFDKYYYNTNNDKSVSTLSTKFTFI